MSDTTPATGPLDPCDEPMPCDAIFTTDAGHYAIDFVTCPHCRRRVMLAAKIDLKSTAKPDLFVSDGIVTRPGSEPGAERVKFTPHVCAGRN